MDIQGMDGDEIVGYEISEPVFPNIWIFGCFSAIGQQALIYLACTQYSSCVKVSNCF